MKRLIKAALMPFGLDLRRTKIPGLEFTISGIKYQIDPCSAGQQPQGEMTGKGAIRMIEERQLRNLRILDICCGVGIIGLTIFSKLGGQSVVKGVGFADINIFNRNSFFRTLKNNRMEGLVGDQIWFWLSDGLKYIPRGEKFDLIVSNPPHFFVEEYANDSLSPLRLAMYDADWGFHKSFYEQCHDYLTEKGEVWFLENGSAVTENDLLPFIKANDRLKYVTQITEPLDPGFFWMISQRS